MDELAAFFGARLDELETTAKATSRGRPDGEEWRTDENDQTWLTGTGVVRVHDDGPLAMAIGSYAADHIALNDPAAVLADVAADRALLAALAGNPADSPGDDADGGWSNPALTWRDGQFDGLLLAVKLRAARFSAHPDYRPEWKL